MLKSEEKGVTVIEFPECLYSDSDFVLDLFTNNL